MQQPLIDPVIFSLGPLQVRWYGMMYVLGFVVGTLILRKMYKDGRSLVSKEKIDSLITYLLIGMLLGARTFYVLIYNWDYYVDHLAESFALWKGGLSFHGALVGLILGGYIFSRRHKVPFLHLGDVCCTMGAQGLFWGRIGNFINGELYGRVTDVAWGMKFPGAGPYPRHPSQLYEAFFEGAVLFSLLWFLRNKLKRDGELFSLFIIGYGVFRFCIEFFREADSQLGYYFGDTLTMGQILCFLMVLVGASLWIYVRRRNISSITK